MQVTFLPNSCSGSSRWSPDGRKIAFDGNASGNYDISVVGAEGGQPKRITTSDGNKFRPSWSRDGNWIYHCSTRTGEAEVFKIPAAGGAEVRVTKHGSAVAFESVDGEDVYFTKDQDLWKIPVKGGNETRLLSSLFRDNFTVVKRGIYFIGPRPSPEAPFPVHFLDFATRAAETVA